MPGGFQQASVLKLSPDYKIFLNGLSSLPIQSSKSDPQFAPLTRLGVNSRDLAHDLAGCNISMSIESSPGSADFVFNVPRHRTEALAYIRDGEILIKPMTEVHIYLRGRFNDKDNAPLYYLAFWGIIHTVTESYSDGSHTISCNCFDMLHWWAMTKVTISASNFQGAMSGADATGMSSIYTSMDAHSIIYDLGKVSMQNFFLPDGINVQGVNDGRNPTDTFNREVTFTALYWQERFKSIRSSMRMFGFAGFDRCHNKTIGSDQPDANARTEAGTTDKNDPVQRHTGGNYTMTIVRTCDNQIQSFYPYKTTEGRSAGQQEGQARTKLEIAKEVAANLHWEFFMDMDGTIVFKPPFYNMDVRGNESSIVRDIDIINYSRLETEQGAITSLYVKGRNTPATAPDSVYAGWWIDYPRLLELGLRHDEREEWRLTSPTSARAYAQSELIRHNAMLETMDVTIPGRPELRLGYPIYIEPLDSFYYIYSISHNIQSGGTFTTAISLKGKRTRVRTSSGRVRRLLAAIQKSNANFPQKVGESEPVFSAVDIALANSAQARAFAGAAGSVARLPKGKQQTTLESVVTDSRFQAIRQRDRNSAFQTSDPCSETYDSKILDKVIAVNANQKDNRATKDGSATGDWTLEEFHPVVPREAGSDTFAPMDESQIPTEMQITDEQGYKLFGPFLFGRFVALNITSVLEVARPDGSVDKRHAATLASNVQAGDPTASGDPAASLRYLINPNVGAIRLGFGSREVSTLGAGALGEGFRAQAALTERAVRPKRGSRQSVINLNTGKIAVDAVNNCEKGSVAEQAAGDSPEGVKKKANVRIAQLRSRKGAKKRRRKSLIERIVERQSEIRGQEENGS